MIKIVYKKIVSEKVRNQIYIKIRKIRSYFLKGNNFYCPCCEKSYRKFLDKGNGIENRKNAICPNCGSLERTRLLFLYLKNNTKIFDGNPSVLHFAPEEALKNKLKDNKNYMDVDLNPNLATYKMDITEIEAQNEKYDFIICSHVLGHIPDERKAIKELYRVLKNGGDLFLLSLMDLDSKNTIEDKKHNTPYEKLKAYGEKDLERLYGNDFLERIKSEAVTIEKIDYRDNFSNEQKRKMSLGNGEREIIYKVHKK